MIYEKMKSVKGKKLDAAKARRVLSAYFLNWYYTRFANRVKRFLTSGAKTPENGWPFDTVEARSLPRENVTRQKRPLRGSLLVFGIDADVIHQHLLWELGGGIGGTGPDTADCHV
jgi:hypothetical protein